MASLRSTRRWVGGEHQKGCCHQGAPGVHRATGAELIGKLEWEQSIQRRSAADCVSACHLARAMATGIEAPFPER